MGPLVHSAAGSPDAPAASVPGLDEMLAALEAAAATSRSDAERATLEELAAALHRWASGLDERPLEVVLGVGSIRERRRAMRDTWVRRAMSALPAAGPWTAALALEAAWSRFVTRGPWLRWRELDAPPADADELDVALWHATRLSAGEPLTARQIARIAAVPPG